MVLVVVAKSLAFLNLQILQENLDLNVGKQNSWLKSNYSFAYVHLTSKLCLRMKKIQPYIFLVFNLLFWYHAQALVNVSLDGGKKKACCASKKVGRCIGSAFCTACTNCSACKYCAAGGTCGVCAGRKKNVGNYSPNTYSRHNTGGNSNYVNQCLAITKKGTQCSRRAVARGYCRQHGG